MTNLAVEKAVRGRKRGHGEGSVRHRADGRWEGRITIADGRRKSVFGRTRQEAVRKMNELQQAQLRGEPVPRNKQTVAAYLDEWMSITAPTLKHSSSRRYALAIKKHIAPLVGHIRLAKLAPQHIQGLHASLLQKGLAPATVCHVHNILNAAMGDAERWEIIVRNPVRLVSPPRIPRHKTQTLSAVEAQRLIAVAHSTPDGALFVLLLTTGLRVGEALACKWSSLDLERGRLEVVATLSRTGEGYQPSETKTDSGRRLVLLPDDAVEALRHHRVLQSEQRLHAGPAWSADDYVFTDASGRTLNPDGYVRRQWKALLHKCELPDRRLHDLRHSAATLQLEQGTPAKIVSEQLGHSNIAITMNLYSHVTEGMQEQARQAMNRALGRA